MITGGLSPGNGRPDDPTIQKRIQQTWFLERVYDQGTAPYFNGIGEHVYPKLTHWTDYADWSHTESVTIDQLRDARTYGGDTRSSAPIWLTEVGVSTSPLDNAAVGVNDQGPILAAMYNEARIEGEVKVYLINRYRDHADRDVKDHNGHMGVVYNDGVDKPAYGALGCDVGEREPYCTAQRASTRTRARGR